MSPRLLRPHPAALPAVAACVAALLTLGACDGGSGPGPGGTPGAATARGGTTAPAGGAVTRETLIEAVLTDAELPPGYDEVVTPLRENTGPPGDPGISDPACRPLTTDALPAPRPGVVAERNFSGEDGTPTSTASGRLEAYTTADLDRRMAELEQALSTCAGWTNLNEDGTSTTATVTRLDAPRLGDGAVAYRVDTTGGLLDGSVAEVRIRVGDVLLTLAGLELGGDPATLPTAGLMRAQVDKLRRVLAGRAG
jgi:hypothetical protein